MPTTQEADPFASANSLDELLVSASAALTHEELDRLLSEGDLSRQMLRRAQQRLERAGMRDLAGLVAKHAKTAKRGLLSFSERLAARLKRKRRAERVGGKAQSKR
jgi:ABC-type branched-subunit amino acid transport system ATPase component